VCGWLTAYAQHIPITIRAVASYIKQVAKFIHRVYLNVGNKLQSQPARRVRVYTATAVAFSSLGGCDIFGFFFFFKRPERETVKSRNNREELRECTCSNCALDRFYNFPALLQILRIIETTLSTSWLVPIPSFGRRTLNPQLTFQCLNLCLSCLTGSFLAFWF
jgi:hypothetical protein